MLDNAKTRILTAEMSWLQRITGVTRLQKIRNIDTRQVLGSQTTLLDKIVQRRLRWFGHVERMADPDYDAAASIWFQIWGAWMGGEKFHSGLKKIRFPRQIF